MAEEENRESEKRRSSLSSSSSSEEESSSVAAVDRLSNLSDDILDRILALVPTRLAVQTSVLSRRWSRLWRTLPALDLDGTAFPSPLSFTRFVYRVISDRNFAATIHLPAPHRHLAEEPAVGLRNLRTFRLANVSSYGAAMWRLVSNCPLLEDVEISGSFTDTLDIASDSLMRLSLEEVIMPGASLFVAAPSLRTLFLQCARGKGPSLVYVSAPNLASFHYYGSRRQTCLLVGEFPCLFEAGVGISDFAGYGKEFDVRPMLRRLKNASVMTLVDMAVIYLSKKQNLPTFLNLKHMKLLLNKRLDRAIIEVIVELLSHSPKLEKLEIHEGQLRCSKALHYYQKKMRVWNLKGCLNDIQLLKILCKNKNTTLSISPSLLPEEDEGLEPQRMQK